MNGELFQICSLAAASKKAIFNSTAIQYKPGKYENRIRFFCLPEKKLFCVKQITAPNVQQWFEHIRDRGLQDVKLLCPVAVKDRQILGFSNTSQSCVLCFFQDGSVTYFTADWQFDSAKRKWDILYSEHEWPNPPADKPIFENNTDSFRRVLADIKNLAVGIGCMEFAAIFGNALDILEGSIEYPDQKYGLELPQIPPEQLQIFEAASCADVFGAMGSWNDSPPYMAKEKGLGEEYDRLSDELLKNIRLAILYAINEW